MSGACGKNVKRCQSEKRLPKEKISEVYLKLRSKSCFSTFFKRKSRDEQQVANTDVADIDVEPKVILSTEDDEYINITRIIEGPPEIPSTVSYVTPIPETGSDRTSPSLSPCSDIMTVNMAPIQETHISPLPQSPVMPCAIKLSNIVLFGTKEHEAEIHSAMFGEVIEDGLYVVTEDNMLHSIISPAILSCLPEPQASATPTLPHPPEYLVKLLRDEIALQDANLFPTIVHIQEHRQSEQYPVLHLMATQLFLPGKSTYVIPFDLDKQLKAPLFAKPCQHCGKNVTTVQDHLLDQVATACCNTDPTTEPVFLTCVNDFGQSAINIELPVSSPHLAILYRGHDKLLKRCYDDTELAREAEKYAKEAITKRVTEIHQYCSEQQCTPHLTHLSSDDDRHKVMADTGDAAAMQWNWFVFFAYLKACGMKYSHVSLSREEFTQLAPMFYLSTHESDMALEVFQQLQLLCCINGRYYICAQNIAQSLISLASKTLDKDALTPLERDLLEHLLKQKKICKERKLTPFMINFHTDCSNPFNHAHNKKIPPIYVLPSTGMTPPGFFESFVVTFASGGYFRPVYSSHSSTTFEFRVKDCSKYFVRVSRKKQFIKVEFSREINETMLMEEAGAVSNMIWKQVESTMFKLQGEDSKIYQFLECADRRCEQKHKQVHLTQIDLLRNEVICCKEKVRDKIDTRHKIWIATLTNDLNMIKSSSHIFKDMSRPNSATSAELEDNPVALEQYAAERIKITQGSFKCLFDNFVKKNHRALDSWIDLTEVRQHFFQYKLIDGDTAQSLMESSHDQRSQCITTILECVERAGPSGVVALVSVVKRTIRNNSQDDHQQLYRHLSADIYYEDIRKLWLHSIII